MHWVYHQKKFERFTLSIGFCKLIEEKDDEENLRFRDRFRTAINVFGDSIGCAIVQHLSAKELQKVETTDETLLHENPTFTGDDDDKEMARTPF